MNNGERGNARGIFRIVNFSCSSCLSIIRRSLNKIDGIQAVGINYITDKVYVDYDPEKVTPEQIKRAISKAGYKTL